MRNRWNAHTPAGRTPLDLLVQRSRLIGEEESLGLFGGGNTSLKGRQPDLFGNPHDVLWIKGSGADLRNCQAKHFAALALAPMRQLRSRAGMTDAEMVRFLERCLLDPKSPRPSIETLLHAFIPEASIDHTHADAILSLTNTPQGQALVRRVLGNRVLWIPYVQPGFALSRRVFEAYQAHPGSWGAVLEKHGLITWGPDSRTSYGRTITLVTRAERLLSAQARRRRWSAAACGTLPSATRIELLHRCVPTLRRILSTNRRVCLSVFDDAEVMEFVNAARLREIATAGPATPDHMLRTKRLPLIVSTNGRAAALTPKSLAQQLERYAQAHRRYFAKHRGPDHTLQDPYPRVILIPGAGMLTSGKDATEGEMVAAIYRHAMRIMRNAARLGGYTSVSEREAFGIEYWPLELYKLSIAPPEAELSRQIGLITGAVGGIGRAIAEKLVDAGASVAVADLERGAVEQLATALNVRVGRRRALPLVVDVTDENSVRRGCEMILRTFGGIDFLVSNAGVADVAAIDQLERAVWDRSFAVNATGHFLVAREVIRWLKAQGMGGALVFVASKNVLAPGKEFGAYSAAKAAETQLARVLAIENGEVNIRVNVVNPDGVFEGSGLWARIRNSRAKSHRIRPEELEHFYQQRNLLKMRVLPSDVAEAVSFFISPRAAKTTGCILTVDGGLREAFPR